MSDNDIYAKNATKGYGIIIQAARMREEDFLKGTWALNEDEPLQTNVWKGFALLYFLLAITA